MQVRELVTKLGFDADTTQAKRYDQSLNSVYTTSRRLVRAFTVLYSATIAGAHATAQYAENLGLAADRVDLSNKKFQELTYALQELGEASANEAREAIESVNRSLGEAMRGSDSAMRTFAELGFSMDDVRRGNVDAEQAILALQNRLQESSSDIEAARIASDVLGDSIGENLGPAIRSGEAELSDLVAQFRDLDGHISDDLIESSAEYNDALNELGVQVRAIGSELAAGILPVMTDIVESFSDFIYKNREAIESGFLEFVKLLRTVLEGVAWGFRQLANIMSPIVNAFGGFENTVSSLTRAFTILIGMRIARWLIGIGRAALMSAGGFAAIGAAMRRIPGVGLLILLTAILEDLYSYLKRGEGAFADLSERIEEAGGIVKYLEEVFENAFTSIDNFVDNVIEGVRQLAYEILDLKEAALSLVGLGESEEDRERRQHLEAGRAADGSEVDEIPDHAVPAAPPSDSGDSNGGSESISRTPIPAHLSPSMFGVRRQASGESNVTINVTPNVEIPAGTSTEQREQIRREMEDSSRRIIDEESRRIIQQIGSSE